MSGVHPVRSRMRSSTPQKRRCWKWLLRHRLRSRELDCDGLKRRIYYDKAFASTGSERRSVTLELQMI
jgi:hypothetical protein